MADMFETIDTCPVPVIARVHGSALGGGMGLCAVADLVIAESGTRFGFTETRLGILPAVISPFVIAKIGESHARALFPGGRRFDATRAARIGLVHEIVEGEDGAGRRGRGGRRRPAGGRSDGGASREGDRPRGPRAGPRIGEMAHGAGHRAAADERGGPGRVSRVHREATSGLDAGSVGHSGRAGRRAGRHALICDDRDIDVRGTESQPGCRAHRGDDALRPALDRERSTARATRWGPLACRK